MKKLFLIAGLLVVTASLGACSNTLSGVGKDISHAGDKIDQTF
tara:strand:- start:50 stop:178 length:129 start_codon:yes stop_codon:yes gene_type:complete